MGPKVSIPREKPVKLARFGRFFLGMDTVVVSEVCLGEKWPNDTENLNEEFWGQRPGLESY